MKIVVIGAGSRSFGRKCVVDVLGAKSMHAFAPELALVDIDPERLETMRQFAELVKTHHSSPATISATTDREIALEGADYVLISVTRDRYALWEQDYRLPLSHGFMHAYGENGGPGALFHALRSIHLILPICRDIERICPNALVFNYSNPESRVLLAMLTMTNLKAVGLCHGQHNSRQLIAKYLDIPVEDVVTEAAGINHFFWITAIRNRRTEEDLYPRVREHVTKDTNPDHALMKKLLEVFGHLTFPHNSHIGEYVPYAAEYMHNIWRYGREAHKASEPLQNPTDPLLAYINGEQPIEKGVRTSAEMGVPMILAHATNTAQEFPAGNLLNDTLAIPNLQPEGVVEVPVVVDGTGMHPQTVAPLPEALAAYCRLQMSIQKLTVEAYKQRSKNLILQTLLLEPTVNSISHAEMLIDEMLELQADYLPEFT